MREIKFRAWNEFEEREILGEGEMVTEENSGLSSANILDRFDVVMQYTGLKDKNGTEIYEGDVLSGYPHGTVKVAWCDKYACFESVSIDDPTQENVLFANDLKDCFGEWEIIGNIHEHPELLGAKTEV